MSLDWDATACDPRALEESEWRMTEAIIFAMMGIGLGSITEKNAEEFAERLHAWQKVYGPVATDVTPDGLVGVEAKWPDVKLRIGLRTNVSTISYPKFKNQLIRRVMEDAAAKVRKEKAADDNA